MKFEYSEVIKTNIISCINSIQDIPFIKEYSFKFKFIIQHILNVEFWICFFFVHCITAITYNCWYYNKSQHKIHFWTNKKSPQGSIHFLSSFHLVFTKDFSSLICCWKKRFQVHRVSSVHHFFQQTKIWQMHFLLFHGTASCHWKHRGATSSAESGNKRSVSLEYLEYPLWKSKVFFGVKKETVFPQRSVGETPLCSRCSRTPMICSTPSEHFLSRLIILHLRDKKTFTWVTFNSEAWRSL